MNALIFGRRRQGKSTLALRLALTYHHTCFIFDPNNQFTLAVPTVDDLQELQEWIDNPDIDHGVIVFRPSAVADERDEEFSDLVEIIWPLGNYALVIDEASTVQNHARMHPQLERLMRQAPRDGARDASGRVVDVSVFQTLHRPVDAHSVCRALASDQFIFQTSLKRDLDIVEAQFGPEVAGRLTTLPRWNMVHCWTGLDGKEEFATWGDPRIWRLEIGPGRGGGT